MSKATMRRPDARAMARLLAEQTQTAAGLILRLAWRQGLTREEIQRLTWNDVDFSAHQLRLPDRTIPLEAETEDCLRRQAERPGHPAPFVVVSDRRRQQMPPESISRLARKTLDRAGLGGISLMDLRHDFIIRQLESHDWPYVARISGIAVPTLYAVFSDYLPEGRQKASCPRREVDGFLMWKLLQAEGSSPVGLALWMGWKLGMQVREMTVLTWDQVDLDRGLLRLPDRDLPLGVTLRRLLRAAAGRRRPGEDPHVLLTPNSRRPLDQPRLSKMVRTALIRGGMEHISLGDLCREERRENEDARLLAYAAEKGTISRSEAMSLLGLSKVAAYERLRQLAERGKLVRVGGKYYPAGQVVPPEEQYDVIRTFLEQSGPAYRQDLAAGIPASADGAGFPLCAGGSAAAAACRNSRKIVRFPLSAQRIRHRRPPHSAGRPPVSRSPCLFLAGDQRQPGLHGVQLLLHIADDVRTHDISLAVHDICGGVGGNVRNEVLVEIALRIRRDIAIGHALFLQNLPGRVQLLLALAGVGAHADEVDVPLLEILIQLLQFGHLGDAGAAAVVPEIDDGGVIVGEHVAGDLIALDVHLGKFRKRRLGHQSVLFSGAAAGQCGGHQHRRQQ